MTDTHTILQTRFGLSDFRPGQEALLDAMLSGQDVLAAMPHGGGKSLCWQMAAAAVPGLTLMLSPAPQTQQQLEQLRSAGLPAVCLDKEADPDHYQSALLDARTGAYRVICTTPAQLGPDLMALACASPVSLVAVEDAQLISPRCPDHRDDYQFIPNFVRLMPTRPVVGAFTPTAVPEIREDIQSLLLLHDPLCITAGFQRDNLDLDVAAPLRKDPWLLDFIARHPGQCGIVCCTSTAPAQALHGLLLQNGVAAVCLYPGLSAPERLRATEAFLSGKAQLLVTAENPTNGPVPPDLRFLIHYNIPISLSEYARQLTVATGGDGRRECVLLFSPTDIQAARFRLPGEENRRQLDLLMEYCKTTDCLQAHLLRHLGQPDQGHCGHCGNCISRYVQQDITQEARLILTAVGHIEERFAFGLGRPLIVPMLQGSRERRILRMGLDQLPDFGVLSNLSKPQIRAYIDALIREGCLYTTEGEFPVLRRTDLGVRALAQGEPFTYKVRMKKQSGPKPLRPALSPEDAALAQELMALRTSIARELALPAYVIFSNDTLADMAQRKPRNQAELLQVSGVGKVKAGRYGERFLACIQNWMQNH